MSGVPSQFSHDELIDKVATALDLRSASQFVVETRDWKDTTPKSNDLTTSTLQLGSMYEKNYPP